MSALQLFPVRSAVAKGIQIPFGAAGGTGPYTFSIAVPNYGGGTIDSAGLYTAGLGKGLDTVIVTDSLGEKTQSNVWVWSPLQLLCDIIEQEMCLQCGRVWVWDQKINEPEDSEIFVVVRVVNTKSYGNSNKPMATTEGLSSVQVANMSATLGIDIKSRNTTALERKEEILLALRSNYAQAQQELNNFSVGWTSDKFLDLSEVDGAAIPYRFNLTVQMQYAVEKIKAVPYYDTFDKVTIKTEP